MEFLLLAALLGAPASSLFRRGRSLALVLAGLTTLLGVATDRIAPLGLLALASLFLAAWWSSHGPLRLLGTVVFIPAAIALGFGLLPGFEPLVLWEPTVLKMGSEAYGLRIRIEKVLVGVALLVWFVRPLTDPRASLRGLWRAAPVALGTGAAVYGVALVLGYVRFVPALLPWEMVLLWVAVNLLAVCIVEEGFFRGLVQERLTRRLPVGVAIGVAAMLFGLAHAGGGVTYVLLSTLAGVGYGLSYEKAGRRIEAAVLAHFLLNAGHFALFTYPFAVA